MEKISVFCILSSYLLASVFALIRARRAKPWNSVLTLVAAGAGFFAHTMYLLVRSRDAELPPLLTSNHDWLLVLAWVAMFLYLFLTMLDRRLPLGIFVLPVVLVLVIASRFVSVEVSLSAAKLRETAQFGWVMLHTGFLVFGIVGVIGSLILSLMYLLQHRRLKHGQGMAEGTRLPSLAKLERWNWWSVVISVPTLTLGMAAGVFLGLNSKEGGASLPFSDPLVIGSATGWLVMVCFFGWLIATRRPAAKQVALLTVWACGFLLITVVGLQVLLGTGHKML